MQLGMVGLGRMGSGMTKRLEQHGHELKTYDPNVESTAKTLRALAKQLEPPRHVWLMVPSGKITEDTFQKLVGILEPGDTIVDGGNSNFRDSQRRYAEARKGKLQFVDVGVSGGIWGLEVGFCLMAGGDKGPVQAADGRSSRRSRRRTAGRTSARSGAGHFTKMVHNGIEYGLMQAYAEGFELMNQSEFELDLSEIAGIWRYGSVVRSWLLELLHEALEEHGDGLDDIAPYVEDSGEGRWTINAAIDSATPLPAITSALYSRFASRREIDFSAKVQAALRNQFGGHAVKAVKAAKKAPRPAVSTSLRPTRCSKGCGCGAHPTRARSSIFGASGDLTQRKLFPALYSLAVAAPAARALRHRRRRAHRADDEAVGRGDEEGGRRARARRARRRRLGRARRRDALRRDRLRRRRRRGRRRRGAARAGRGARHGRQPRLLPRRPAGGVRDDRERARRAAQRRAAGRG